MTSSLFASPSFPKACFQHKQSHNLRSCKVEVCEEKGRVERKCREEFVVVLVLQATYLEKNEGNILVILLSFDAIDRYDEWLRQMFRLLLHLEVLQASRGKGPE